MLNADGVRAMNPFIIKLAGRCNLNCSYCYVYNQADTGWKRRPAMMADETFDKMLGRIAEHCRYSGQSSVLLLFHGGEPTLVGSRRFELLCQRARKQLGEIAKVAMGIQTNGTLLSQEWIRVFREQEVQVGISMDGPREVNDLFRIDHHGRGSYDAVARGIELLCRDELPFTILSVIQLGEDPLRIHRHFRHLGCRSISYLLPSYTHDTIAEVRQRFGPTPCADFLIPIFDDWWCNDTVDVTIREFWNIGRVIMGGTSQLDSIGNPPLSFVSIETDGSIQGLDKLRTCADEITDTGLSVHESNFRDITRASPFHAAVMHGLPLSQACRSCPEGSTCAGGYVPHRYSSERQFDNPSVWCADLFKLFAHVRERMGISHRDTTERQGRLARGAMKPGTELYAI